MPEKLASAIAAWRDADASARAAENLLAQAWLDYENRRGPAVSPQLINDVARLRDVANDRLTVALSLLRPRG